MVLENSFLILHLMDWNSLSLSEVVNERIFNQDIPSMFTQSSLLLSSIKKIVFFFAGYYRFFKSFFIYFFPGEKPRNYQESNFACNSISISRILDTSDLSWRQEMGLWSPAYNTFRIIDNIR